jgi:hypothetical protein
MTEAKKKLPPFYPKTIDIRLLKKGDRITRIKPAEIDDAEIEDVSFIGTPVIFLGIANGCLYLERDSQAEKMLYGTYIKLPLFFWSKHWVMFEEPEFLENINVLAVIEQELNSQYEKTLVIELEKAEENDDFEKARLIQAKMDEIAKKRQEFQKKNPLPPFPSIQMIYNNHMNNGNDEENY